MANLGTTVGEAPNRLDKLPDLLVLLSSLCPHLSLNGSPVGCISNNPVLLSRCQNTVSISGKCDDGSVRPERELHEPAAIWVTPALCLALVLALVLALILALLLLSILLTGAGAVCTGQSGSALAGAVSLGRGLGTRAAVTRSPMT